jgi:uncharacterized protein involved in type VI secretion and phage assembly
MQNPFEAMMANANDAQLNTASSMLYEGIVTQNVDPDGKNRVVVKITSMFGVYETLWASVISPYAGDGHGVSYVPEVGDIVIVGFLSGNFGTPVVLGCVFGVKDDGSFQTTPNNGDTLIKAFQTKAGNKLFLSDTDGEESIHVEDVSGNKIVLDTNGVFMQCKNGAQVKIDKDGVVSITTDGDCNVNAANVNVAGNGNLVVGSNPLPPKGFCSLPNCVFSGAPHTVNQHPMT